MERWHRSKIQSAPYNPRSIDERSRKKLRDNLKRVGLISPITVNRRTGNIVSGHQRISIIDSIERSHNYFIDVAVIDVDEKTEREQVVFMNNESAMGSWESDLLLKMVEDDASAIDTVMAGFDKLDLQALLGKDLSSVNDIAEVSIKEAQCTSDRVAELKSAKREQRKRAVQNADTEFQLVMVFDDRRTQEEFLRLLKLDESVKWIDGVRVLDALRAMFK